MFVKSCRTEKQHTCARVITAGEWFGIGAFDNLEGSVHIPRIRMSIHTHTADVPWNCHRICVKMLYENDDGVPYKMELLVYIN